MRCDEREKEGEQRVSKRHTSCLPHACRRCVQNSQSRTNVLTRERTKRYRTGVEDGAWWYHRYVLNEFAASDRRDP